MWDTSPNPSNFGREEIGIQEDYQVNVEQTNCLEILGSSLESNLQRFGESLKPSMKRSFETYLEQNWEIIQSMGAVWNKDASNESGALNKRRCTLSLMKMRLILG